MSDILLSEKAGRDAHLLRHAIRSGETVATMSAAQFNDLSTMNEQMFNGAAQIEFFSETECDSDVLHDENIACVAAL